MLNRARSTIAAVTAAAVLSATSVAVVPTAQAAEQSYNGAPIVHVGNKKGKWHGNKKYWKYSNKHRYRDRHNNGGNIALGIFGFAAGAMLGSALAQQNHYPGTNMDAFCSQKYKTYKPWTGTYTGYDGREHPCRYP